MPTNATTFTCAHEATLSLADASDKAPFFYSIGFCYVGVLIICLGQLYRVLRANQGSRSPAYWALYVFCIIMCLLRMSLFFHTSRVQEDTCQQNIQRIAVIICGLETFSFCACVAYQGVCVVLYAETVYKLISIKQGNSKNYKNILTLRFCFLVAFIIHFSLDITRAVFCMKDEGARYCDWKRLILIENAVVESLLTCSLCVFAFKLQRLVKTLKLNYNKDFVYRFVFPAAVLGLVLAARTVICLYLAFSQFEEIGDFACPSMQYLLQIANYFFFVEIVPSVVLLLFFGSPKRKRLPASSSRLDSRLLSSSNY